MESHDPLLPNPAQSASCFAKSLTFGWVQDACYVSCAALTAECASFRCSIAMLPYPHRFTSHMHIWSTKSAKDSTPFSSSRVPLITLSTYTASTSKTGFGGQSAFIFWITTAPVRDPLPPPVWKYPVDPPVPGYKLLTLIIPWSLILYCDLTISSLTKTHIGKPWPFLDSSWVMCSWSTVSWLLADSHPHHRLSVDCWWTNVCRPNRQTVSWQSADCRSTVYWLLADSRLTVDRLLANSRPMGQSTVDWQGAKVHMIPVV